VIIHTLVYQPRFTRSQERPGQQRPRRLYYSDDLTFLHNSTEDLHIFHIVQHGPQINLGSPDKGTAENVGGHEALLCVGGDASGFQHVKERFPAHEHERRCALSPFDVEQFMRWQRLTLSNSLEVQASLAEVAGDRS
jgi:hypothetical protein